MIKILSLMAIMLVGFGWGSSSHAVVSPSDAAKKLVELIKNHTESGYASATDICAESKFMKNTLRLEAGKYCEDPLFANYALLICKYYMESLSQIATRDNKNILIKARDNFLDSKCYLQKIAPKFPITLEPVIAKLKELISKMDQKDKNTICNSISTQFPDICSP